MSVKIVPCDQGCGAQLFAFAGTPHRCHECSLLLSRETIPDGTKAAEWNAAMEWLDGHQAPHFGSNGDLSLKQRLDELWRQLCEA